MLANLELPTLLEIVDLIFGFVRRLLGIMD